MAEKMVVAIGGPTSLHLPGSPMLASAGVVAMLIWAAGAVAMFSLRAARHLSFCAEVRGGAVKSGCARSVQVVSADVAGPVSFGVFRRIVAVPRDFVERFDARERELALAHECAHHARADLIANWVALAMLSIHWWNPIAWLANAAFQDDQEYAADAHVLANAGRSALLPYATLLAKAAGAGAPPACSLNARSNLKGRLMMLRQQPRSLRHMAFSGSLALLLGSAAFAATAVTPVRSGSSTGKQAVTIGVKPDGSGSYSLIVDGTTVAPGAPLPNGLRLPASFGDAGGCDLSAGAKPIAMAIKGQGQVETYTVMCASAAPANLRTTLDEGLASLEVMRTSVATQKATSAFPESERSHALSAIDRSIREVRGRLAKVG